MAYFIDAYLYIYIYMITQLQLVWLKWKAPHPFSFSFEIKDNLYQNKNTNHMHYFTHPYSVDMSYMNLMNKIYYHLFDVIMIFSLLKNPFLL